MKSSNNSCEEKYIFNIYTLNGDHQLFIDKTSSGFEFYLKLLEKFFDVDYQNHEINVKCPLLMTEALKSYVTNFIQEVSKQNKEMLKLEKIIRDIPIGQYFIVFPCIIENKLEILKTFAYLKSINANDSEKCLKSKISMLKKNYMDNFSVLEQEYDFLTFSTKVQKAIGEKQKNKRICRYCGHSMADGAKFNKKAHAISEAIGNKIFISNDECDECNDYFARTIEKDFFEFIKPYRTIFGAKGKSGIPELRYKNGISMGYDENLKVAKIVTHCDSPVVIKDGGLELVLESDVNVNHMNIYRCLVKFALAFLDRLYIEKFAETINWIKNIRNDGSEIALPPVMQFLDRSNYFDQPEIVLYKRKTDDKNYPYLYAELKTCNFVFVYIIPFCSEDKTDFGNSENFERFWRLNKHFQLLDRKWERCYFNRDESESFKYNFKINSRKE